MDPEHTLFCIERGLTFVKRNGYYDDAASQLSVPSALLAVCPPTVSAKSMLALYMHVKIGCAPCLHTAAVLCLSSTGAGNLLGALTKQAVSLHHSGCTPLFSMLQKMVLHPRLSCFLNRVGRHLYATRTTPLAVDAAFAHAMESRVVATTESTQLAVMHAVRLGRIVVFPSKTHAASVVVFPGNTCVRMSWKNHALLLVCLVFSRHPHDLPEAAARLRDALAPCGKPMLAEVLTQRHQAHT